MKDTTTTALGDCLKGIIQTNSNYLIDQVKLGRMTKADARIKLKSTFGENVEIPPELRDEVIPKSQIERTT